MLAQVHQSDPRSPMYVPSSPTGAFLRDHWDADEGRVLINGTVPVNPHGRSLGEGPTQGSGHIREAVHQLQGVAGERQVPGSMLSAIGLVEPNDISNAVVYLASDLSRAVTGIQLTIDMGATKV